MKLMIVCFFCGFSVAIALFSSGILPVSRDVAGLGRALLRRYFPPPR